ncbi:glycosyltransferase [Actinoplanes derwentensis]|uniref:glycosyltransferase n=1 Tax=Actinoplanes derwentensis TaxID=113562 RepID=UPI000AD9AD2E|nr:glycosyltransferase [Actinoplanes derwentensis]
MSVVIPVAPGPDEHLPVLVAALPPVHEVIVVVGPGEDVVRVLPRDARVIRQTRTGHGNALACGVAVATGEVIVTLPGDGSGDPADLSRLVEALRVDADVAEAIRPAGRLGLVLLWFMNVLLGCRPGGSTTGYRAFWRRHTGRIGLPRVAGIEPARGDGSDGEPLVAVRTRAAGLRVAEVPVSGRPRTDLVAGWRAVTGEWWARRRDRRVPTAESFLVMTGGPVRPIPAPIVTGPGATVPRGREQRFSDFRSSGAPINIPRGAAAERQIFEQALPRWPAPNRATEARLAPLNSSGLNSRGGLNNSGIGISQPAGAVYNRRRWRDDHDVTRPRTQGRPNLRVINGEGGDSGGGRGHLRSV